MSRPLRITYPGAWYHVMNHSAGEYSVFADAFDRRRFLALLGEVGERFGLQTHAYCLLEPHYQLLAHTPEGNLSRALRHLDGIYTQHVNRRWGRGGALFRGRYRAILIEPQRYILTLSRYIHRQPRAAGIPLQDYPWSSYPVYLGQIKPEPWLHCERVLAALGGSRARYRAFVEKNTDTDELEQFYGQRRLAPILGSREFIEQVTAGTDPRHPEFADARRILEPPTATAIVAAVAASSGIPAERLTDGHRPRGQETVVRNLALYLCQARGRLPLRAIAQTFRLGHYTSVSSAIANIKQRLAQDPTLQTQVAVIGTLLESTSRGEEKN